MPKVPRLVDESGMLSALHSLLSLLSAGASDPWQPHHGKARTSYVSKAARKPKVCSRRIVAPVRRLTRVPAGMPAVGGLE